MKSTRLKIFLAIVSFFVLPAQSVQAKPSDEIVGVYWSPQKDAKIEIYQKDKRFFGKLVWLAKPKKDIHNPVKTLRNRDVLGVEILTGFSYSDGVYNGGEIYDPESGKTYSCKMTLEGDRLRVRGYIGVSLLGRTEYFTKIK